MSFSRHWEIYPPDAHKETGSRLGSRSRRSSVRMSLSRLFLGGLRSRRARLRLTGQTQNAVQWSCRSRDLQRTAMSVLTVCANRGGNPKVSLDDGERFVNRILA